MPARIIPSGPLPASAWAACHGACQHLQSLCCTLILGRWCVLSQCRGCVLAPSERVGLLSSRERQSGACAGLAPRLSVYPSHEFVGMGSPLKRLSDLPTHLSRYPLHVGHCGRNSAHLIGAEMVRALAANGAAPCGRCDALTR